MRIVESVPGEVRCQPVKPADQTRRVCEGINGCVSQPRHKQRATPLNRRAETGVLNRDNARQGKVPIKLRLAYRKPPNRLVYQSTHKKRVKTETRFPRVRVPDNAVEKSDVIE